jgi:hypothetical protein
MPQFDQAREKGTFLMNTIVLFCEFFTDFHELQAHKLKAFLFKAANDFGHELTLYAIGLDGNKCSFHGFPSFNNLERFPFIRVPAKTV